MRRWFIAPLIALLAATLLRPAMAQEDAPASIDRGAVEAIVRDYLLEHPEVLVEALTAYELKRREQAAAATGELIGELGDALYRDPDSPVTGSADAPVTIVEFFDYNCPHCKAMAPRLERLLEERSDVRVVFKEYPILTPGSEVAARAALAAYRQGPELYLAFHWALMAFKGSLNGDEILKLALQVGLDLERLRVDMEQMALETELHETRTMAGKLGIRGTPAFIIGNKLVPGEMSYESLFDLVEEAEKAAANASAN